MRFRKLRIAWLVGCGLAVIAAPIGAFCIYEGLSVSIRAEYTLNAALLTVKLLDEYVASHDGEWPHSWADLEKLPPRKWTSFKWPIDSHEVPQYVKVDFSADLQQLADQTTMQFDAVRPIGPCYSFKHYGSVDALLKTIRSHTRKLSLQ